MVRSEDDDGVIGHAAAFERFEDPSDGLIDQLEEVVVEPSVAEVGSRLEDHLGPERFEGFLAGRATGERVGLRRRFGDFGNRVVWRSETGGSAPTRTPRRQCRGGSRTTPRSARDHQGEPMPARRTTPRPVRQKPRHAPSRSRTWRRREVHGRSTLRSRMGRAGRRLGRRRPPRESACPRRQKP